MTTPNEHDENSPPADGTRPVLLGMSPAWQAVYDRLREGQALAVLGAQEKPHDAETRAILHASSAAVRAFRAAYETASVQNIARQIMGKATPGME